MCIALTITYEIEKKKPNREQRINIDARKKKEEKNIVNCSNVNDYFDINGTQCAMWVFISVN